MPTIPADAPTWVPLAFWLFFAFIAALFGVLTPRLRSMIARLATPPTDPAVKAIGAAYGMTADATKIAHELERLADAAETIADGIRSIAKSEEQGTTRAIEAMREQLLRLDRRIEDR